MHICLLIGTTTTEPVSSEEDRGPVGEVDCVQGRHLYLVIWCRMFYGKSLQNDGKAYLRNFEKVSECGADVLAESNHKI